MYFFFHVAAIAAIALAASVPQTCTTINPAFAPTWASGYSGRVVINGLQSPRGVVFDTNGNALVVESGKGVRYIALQDNGGTNVCVSSSKEIITDSSLNHGIEFSANGKQLFVSNSTTVFSYNYEPKDGSVSNRQTIITGIGDGGHVTRTLTVLKKSTNDVLVVQVGSNGNNDSSSMDVNSGRAQLRYFSFQNFKWSTVKYTSGTLVGWGLRNDVGVAEHPSTGGLWSVENSMDQVTRDNGINTTVIHNTNPGEELNYLGTYPFNGPQNYGYPLCVTSWDPSVFREPNAPKTGTQFAQSIFNDQTCTARRAPRLAFPSHNAPLDIKFTRDGRTAYISFHGSWDRTPPDGYRLSKVLFGNDGMPLEPSTSTTAAIQVMGNPDLSKCPGACFRPAGLAWDKKDRLYMTSDATGELWIIGGA